MLLIVGSLIVLGSVAGGFLMHGGVLGALWQLNEFIIIGGAALGALVIGTPISLIKALLARFGGFFRTPPTKDIYLDLLALQYQLYRLTQQSGVMALEAHVEEPEKSTIFSKFPTFLANHHAVSFLSDSVRVIILGGVTPHDLESLMDEDLEVHHHEALKPAQTLGKVADALPGLGIVAAVLGIVITMQKIGGPPEEIGHSVAAALVGTFLGILASYGFVQPMSVGMEHQVEAEGRYLTCIKAGLLAVYKGFPPAIAVEFARRTLPEDVRPTFTETEQACKGQKADVAAAA
ncbi:flagellar motor protein MotA [Luteitalea sp. TBR-22]|uniref:flagellar motor stator protein MotA n=1 Tax=Luteitalea sp. TBR-22 TaxID=2802971 RepID=UPI001AFAF889|nr:flagellar motor stator protein MotA [Luteitalea sp. TBR-22]BCS33489.1 flagellar motor protein MotA [Luteitalea sp. TBR-22]